MELNKSKFLLIGLLLTLFSSAAFAGTGGAELSSWYTDISNALTGTWGKIIAAFFIGTAVIIFKQGGIVGGIFMVLLGLSIGSIPTIINSKYTLIAGEMASNSLLATMASFVG